MAPWSAMRRGSQPNNTTNDLIARIHSSALDTPTRLPPSLEGHGREPARVNPDSSDSDSEFHPQSRPRRPGHSRSMSQPFPSLFSGKKKRQNSNAGPSPDLDFTDDDTAMSNQVVNHKRGGGPAGSKDFATGNCMTCGSMVRWPKDLKVFKCTICTTVNDLPPDAAEKDGDGRSRWRRNNHQGPPPVAKQAPNRAQPISIEQTRRIVRQCIHSHLVRKFTAIPSPPIDRPPPPPPKDNPSFGARTKAADRTITIPDSTIRENEAPQSPAIRVSEHIFDDEASASTHPSRTNPEPSPRSFSSSYPGEPIRKNGNFGESQKGHQRIPSRGLDDDVKRIFKPLEDYIVSCFSSFENVNSSFMVHHPRFAGRVGSEPARHRPAPAPRREPRERRQTQSRDLPQPPTQPPAQAQTEDSTYDLDLDPKLLLLGDFAENGLWWTGNQNEPMPPRRSSSSRHDGVDHGKRNDRSEHVPPKPPSITKSPQMNWGELMSWYTAVTNAAEGWFRIYEELSQEGKLRSPAENDLQATERELLKGQEHVRRVLLKATEVLLKRPGRPMTDPLNLRFLLIILENPLLHAETQRFRGLIQPDIEPAAATKNDLVPGKPKLPATGLLSGQHSGIIKRVIGLISNSSIDCHNQLISWFSRLHTARFVKIKELVSGFLTYRMLRQSEKKQEVKVDITAGLIPQMQEGRSGAYLYDEIGSSAANKKQKEPPKKITYSDDWQMKAASRVLALLFTANNQPHVRRGDESPPSSSENVVTVKDIVHAHGQLLPTSDFYNSMIDYADLVADFESWESRKAKFSFCQYPFLLSIWAKTQILEHDARRQMQSKARDAFFDSIMSRRNINQYLMLNVRRDCLVDDSLKAVSEVIGSGSEDVKKGLRITFKGEEGIDGGGLRKEWFLLLVREVFNPEHGMFLYDEDSQYCYFNPNAFETSDQFFLVGVVMGLAIYNSTILDVALPPFAFRKLIASAPSHATSASAHPRPTMRYNLEDLAEYRPRLARGLRQLLDYDDDVESTFCLDFVIETEKYGTTVQVPLCPGGERIPVTNANRREYVDLYVRYVLDVSVSRQFEPFKRGFYTVCGGNALSLFRPEEIELLVRGSDEPLDIASLRAVAEYDNWGSKQPDGSEPVIDWFWESFQEATPQDQRKMLTFVTGGDRIPAMGASMLHIKVSCLGDDSGRYPIARTCFNQISLWRYGSKERLEKMLWTAVHESEGFGLK